MRCIIKRQEGVANKPQTLTYTEESVRRALSAAAQGNAHRAYRAATRISTRQTFNALFGETEDLRRIVALDGTVGGRRI